MIERYKRKNVFIYLDPPYFPSTRKKRIYKHEMTEEDHKDMLNCILKHPGPVMISGYDNQIYRDTLNGWIRQSCPARCEGGQLRTEVIWMNYEPSSIQMSLIESYEAVL